MTQAYSYIRLSSERQSLGDGLRRQLKASEAYAEERGLTLDTSVRDIGVSAFKGKNRLEGALSGFLNKVDRGEIAKGTDYDQAKRHGGGIPLLIVQKDRDIPLAIISLDHFLELVARADK